MLLRKQHPRTHLLIFAVNQGKFEAVLCWVDGEDAWPTLPVQTVHTVSSHTGHVDGKIKGPDDAMIATAKLKKLVKQSNLFHPLVLLQSLLKKTEVTSWGLAIK